MTKQSALRKIAEGLFEYADAMYEEEQGAAGATAAPGAPDDMFPPMEQTYEALPLPADTPGLGKCPFHNTPWTVKSAGVSKMGKPYQSFYKCDGKDPDGTFCNRKPVKGWVDAHPIRAAVPA